MTLPVRFQDGSRLIDGTELNKAFGGPQWETKASITALAGGGRSASTPELVNGINHIGTAASSGDSVILPAASTPGKVVMLYNAGANSAQVFGNGSDTINGTAGSTGVAVTSTTKIIFFAYDVGKWVSFTSA